jgi:hypothetical protein
MNPLISDHYRRQQQHLHQTHDEYGMASVQFAGEVSRIIDELHIKTLLDYGAGKGRLAKHLKVQNDLRVIHYDPAIPDFAQRPQAQEMLCCIDVLEHIEPDYLNSVLDDLLRLTTRIAFVTIHTGPAKKNLSDGRNAHLIQQPLDWWLPKIMARFELFQLNRFNAGFSVILLPKKIRDPRGLPDP